MRLPDIAALAFSGLGDKVVRIKRDLVLSAVCYGIFGICLLVAVAMATSAGLLALELKVGVIYARLIVAGVYVAVGLIALLALRIMTARPVPAVPAAAAAVGARSEQPAAGKPGLSQIAMIVEAVMLGYQLSRRDRR